MIRRRYISLVFAALLAALGVGFTWLAASESGLRFLWATAQEHLPFTLSGEVSGRLLGALKVEGFKIDLPRARVEAASVALRWQPWGLWAGRLLFTGVEVEQLLVTVIPPADGEGGEDKVRVPTLPVLLEVHGEVAGITVRRDGERRVQLERVVLGAVAGPKRLKVRTLTVDGYGAHLEAYGEVALRLDGPVKLATQWSYRPPQGQAVEGHGSVSGTLSRLRTEQEIDAGSHATAKGALAWLDQPAAWRLEARSGAVNLSQFHRPLRPVELAGVVRGSGSGERLDLEASGELRDPTLGRWNFKMEAARQAAAWRLPRLALSARQGPGRLVASGMLPRASGGAGSLKVTWSDLSLPVIGGGNRLQSPIKSPKGVVTVEGSLERYRIAGEAVLARTGVPDGKVTLEAHGNRAGVTLPRLRANWLDGRLWGRGSVAWRPVLTWQAEMRGEAINPGRWNPAWPGRLAGRVVSRGEGPPEKRRAEVELVALRGTLRKQPVSGKGRAVWREGVVQVEGFTLQSGTARLAARGELGARWDVRGEVEADQIGDLLPGVTGRVVAQAELRGKRDAPHFRAEGSASQLSWSGRRVGQLAIKADLDLSGRTPWALRVDAQGVTISDRTTFRQLMVSGEGDPRDHRLVINGEDAGRSLHLEARGSYDAGAKRWAGRLSQGRIEDPLFGRWRQAGPVALVWRPEAVRLDRSCWEKGEASICLALTGGRDQAWRGSAQLRAFPVAAVQTLVDGDFHVTGRLNGEGSFAYRGGLTALDIDLAATDGAFRFQTGAREVIATPYRRLKLVVRSGDEGMAGKAGLSLVSGDHAAIQFSLPQWRPGSLLDPQQPLRGMVETSLGELAWISLLWPDVVATGRLESRFTVRGTLAHPLAQGNAALAGGELALPLLGISLREMGITAVAKGSSMEIEASARSGRGRIEVGGAMAPDEKGWALTLKVKGENVEVARLPQARVVASPDLQVAVREQVVRLQGRLLVPEARIELPKIAAPVSASPDVVVVDRPEATRKRPWSVISEVEVRFGEKVHVTGYGFSGRLGGGIVVVEPAGGGGAVGRGELQIVDGKYSAYGQDLTIETGRLLYGNAPLNNPGIEFRAIRLLNDVVFAGQRQDVTAGIIATGRLKQPEVRLYSRPAMDDSQVLAYLVLGRGLETATTEDTNVLQEAALSLGLAGGTEVARQVASEAGLDVVNVQSNGGQSRASLVLGKYLSPRLYVQYAVGLWESGNAWRMRYLLGRQWTLEAESGVQSGVDLLYTIEE